MSEIEVTKYDSAEYLETQEEIAEYLQAVIEDGQGDIRYLTRALGVVARAQNISRLSRETGLSREGIYKALSDDGNPSLKTVHAILRAMGLELSVTPQRRSV